MTFVIRQVRWYLAYQDGPINNETYDTEKEAKLALKGMSRLERMGICVMSRIYEKDFVNGY